MYVNAYICDMQKCTCHVNVYVLHVYVCDERCTAGVHLPVVVSVGTCVRVCVRVCVDMCVYVCVCLVVCV